MSQQRHGRRGSVFAVRMLSPRELFSAQGFAADYIIDPDPDGHYLAKRLTKTEQIELAGNSVCKHKAAAVVAANLYERPEDLQVREFPAGVAHA